MLQHYVLIKYREMTPAAHIETFCARMLALPSMLDGIERLEIGRDQLHATRARGAAQAGCLTGAPGVAGAATTGATRFSRSASRCRARDASCLRPFAWHLTAATCQGAEGSDGRANDAASHVAPFQRMRRRTT